MNLEVKYLLAHVDFWPGEFELKTAARCGQIHIFNLTKILAYPNDYNLNAAVQGNNVDLVKLFSGKAI